MKVKLKYDFNYVDSDEEGSSTIEFRKGVPYEVIYTYTHPAYGANDHTVYVVINERGETMSLAKGACIHYEDDHDAKIKDLYYRLKEFCAEIEERFGM
jgi:hypothetical protein